MSHRKPLHTRRGGGRVVRGGGRLRRPGPPALPSPLGRAAQGPHPHIPTAPPPTGTIHPFTSKYLPLKAGMGTPCVVRRPLQHRSAPAKHGRPKYPHTAPRTSLGAPVSSSSTQRARLLQTLQLRQLRQKTSTLLKRSKDYNIRFPNIIFPFFTIIFLPILPVPAMARIISNNTGSPSVSRIRSTKPSFASRPGFLRQNEA
jgi:hypothetical protein